MTKLIVLKLDGDFDRGFRVTLEIGSEGDRPETETIGELPPSPELVLQHNNWQSNYRSLGKATRQLKAKRARIDGSLKQEKEECRTQALTLSDRLNTWLKSESFFALREKWLEKASISDEVRVLIRTNSDRVWQLPWHQWDLLERYNFAEIGLSHLTCERPPKRQFPSHRNQMRILAILGNSEGINVEEDRQQLENIPGAATTFLVEPQRRDLSDRLWELPWDILFFAGHSKTEGEKGRIYLNQTDSLTVDELKYALKKAVAGGLQLAIFNSCDGLGLARELEALQIPQTIVMQEPVPDRVAQAFLKYFLQAFSGGKYFYRAVQEARQRLQGLEDEFPCASWLPVICQNPAAMPLVWLESPKSKKLHCWRSLLATSLIVTSLVMGGRSLGVLQFWELKSYDWLLRQRPAELADSRLLIVGADETDLREYKYPLPDAVLARLIAKLEQYRPVAIGLDIFRDRPVSKDLLAAPHLVFVCAIGTNPEDAVAPPPNSPIKQIGFNDLENDRQDNMVRRHLLSRTPNAISSLSPCKTSYSFSLQLANLYLEAKNIPVKTTPQKNWQFGNVVLKRLESRSGGYQNLDARGNQLLINYRASSQIAQKLTIKQVLTDRFEPEWVRDRVVLIGVTAASIQDDRDTPYGRMRGLEVHAHIISQILSSVLDDRPLIWWLPQWGDAIWVWVWSLAGGTLVYWARSPSVGTRLRLLLALITSITGLYGLCWFFLLQGGWLPFVPALLALILTSSALAKLLP